jgi:hypothetical protein
VFTILNLALVTIFVIAVDVAYSQLSSSRIRRALRDHLPLVGQVEAHPLALSVSGVKYCRFASCFAQKIASPVADTVMRLLRV